MKTQLFKIVTAVTLLLFPILNFAQAPDLGTCSTFALFTAAGAFSNDGATVVTGDIGTNVGAFTGFPPGIVFGNINVADGISAQAAADVDVAYSFLDNITCGLVIGTTLGNGQLLTPNVYCLGAASTLNGDLVLDGGGDPSSIFVFEIDGALSTTTLSTVTLTNSASMCNVYWQVNGAVSLGVSSVFQGTIIANGAISLLEAAALNGRALSRGGAIDMHNNVVNAPTSPVASTITSNGGATTFCEGDSVTLSGNEGGVWSTGDTASSITVKTGGDYYVTNTTNCGSETSNHIIVTVTSCSGSCTAPVVTSIDSVCGNIASICWSSVEGATGYLILWREIPNQEWIVDVHAADDTCHEFTNNANAVDEIQLATICANGDTVYGEIFTYDNYDNVCLPPTDLTTSNITATTADLSWTGNADANKYKVVYIHGPNKVDQKLTGTTLSITDLQPSATYKWRVKARCTYCDKNTWGVYSPFTYFTTPSLKGYLLEDENSYSINVYPNPSNGNFSLQMNLGIEENESAKIEITDVIGRKVYSEMINTSNGNITNEISLSSEINDGVYLIIITAGDKQYREQLVINKD